MVIVDTSIWIDHFRRTNGTLVALLEEKRVLVHPFIIGDIACGNLARRQEVLTLLSYLPVPRTASHAEVLNFVGTKRLYGMGIGWMDAHLLAASLLSDAGLLTLDKSLARAAKQIGIDQT